MCQNNSPYILTSTEAVGVAIADYDRVDFTVVLTKQGGTGEEAKQLLDAVVSNLHLFMITLVQDGVSLERVVERQRTAVNWAYDNRRNERVMNGYVATHTISFQISDVDTTAKVYDCLARLDSAQVDYKPKLEHENLVRLQNDAFKDAYARAVDRVKAELAFIFTVDGPVATGVVVGSYIPRYDDSLSAGRQPKAMAFRAVAQSAEASSENDEIHLGKAEVKCHLQVNWSPCEPSESMVK